MIARVRLPACWSTATWAPLSGVPSRAAGSARPRPGTPPIAAARRSAGPRRHEFTIRLCFLPACVRDDLLQWRGGRACRPVPGSAHPSVCAPRRGCRGRAASRARSRGCAASDCTVLSGTCIPELLGWIDPSRRREGDREPDRCEQQEQRERVAEKHPRVPVATSPSSTSAGLRRWASPLRTLAPRVPAPALPLLEADSGGLASSLMGGSLVHRGRQVVCSHRTRKRAGRTGSRGRRLPSRLVPIAASPRHGAHSLDASLTRPTRKSNGVHKNDTQLRACSQKINIHVTRVYLR